MKPATPKFLFDHQSGHHLQVGDARIYHEITGNPEGTPLLLLHGGLGKTTDFNGLLDRLPERFKFIGMDLRGHGRSTLGSAPLTYQQYQQDVEALLSHLGIKHYTLLGFSDGGIVAYRLASEHPDAIQKLITVGAQWRLDPEDPIFEMLGSMTADFWESLEPGSTGYYNRHNPEPDFEALVRAVVGLWTDTRTTGYPGKTVEQIQAPTLLIRGDEDHLFSLHEAAMLQQQIEGAKVLNLPFAGHDVHASHPDLFLSVVNAFLSQDVSKDGE